ncbi:nucleotidyltransferase family protein [Microcystis sp. CS-574]|uniref:nucleotidyltransferase domain-containing protein n=1 Tax=Microcystis sp. CS-574 TaxID=3021718 RepID=UPI00232E53F4|nr:nucleotidyltransferase family protein [Microcystis sp. CS-574]MDB9405994.1 nucleotidyltransferase family protein [Microcystis sp. CS-574]
MTVAQTQLSFKESAQTTRPEIELLLCCARTHIDPTTEERLEVLLQQDIDWTYLIQTSARHGVMPLLYRSLNATCPELVPKPILSQLRNFFHTNAQHNLLLTQELLRLLNLFQEHEIPAIPFKGPVLAASVYGNLARRQFGDLDILVHERDYQQAKELLLSQGYRMLYDSEHEANCLQAQLWHTEQQLSVDLHYGIPPKQLQLKQEALWECLASLSLAGTTIQVFSPEAHLLVLCVDGYKEYWHKLSRICDLAAMIGNQELDWERLRELARKLKLERILSLGLLLTSELLEASLPEKIWSRVEANSAIRGLAARLQKDLFSEENPQSPPFSLWTIALYHLYLSECQPDRLRYWLTPNTSDRAFLSLPASLSFFYYLLRPIRVIGKYGLSPFQGLFKQLRLEVSE